MTSSIPIGQTYPAAGAEEAPQSAVSWQAIIAGAVAASALSFILLALGAGLGLVAVSPWPNSGASAKSFTYIAAIWLVLIQWISAGLGGFLAGRLRTSWTRLPADEVHFRDTAHGLLVWALGTVLSVALLASSAGSLVSGASSLAGGAASGLGQGAAQVARGACDSNGYFIDQLFRSEQPAPNANPGDQRGEATRILVHSLADASVSGPDKAYLGRLVATRTGLSQVDAEKRVDDVVNQAKAAAEQAQTKLREAADAARKISSDVAIYTFLSMLIGAFIASVAAALGGGQRDEALRSGA